MPTDGVTDGSSCRPSRAGGPLGYYGESKRQVHRSPVLSVELGSYLLRILAEGNDVLLVPACPTGPMVIRKIWDRDQDFDFSSLEKGRCPLLCDTDWRSRHLHAAMTARVSTSYRVSTTLFVNLPKSYVFALTFSPKLTSGKGLILIFSMSFGCSSSLIALLCSELWVVLRTYTVGMNFAPGTYCLTFHLAFPGGKFGSALRAADPATSKVQSPVIRPPSLSIFHHLQSPFSIPSSLSSSVHFRFLSSPPYHHIINHITRRRPPVHAPTTPLNLLDSKFNAIQCKSDSMNH